jgi:hypothetical protein
MANPVLPKKVLLVYGVLLPNAILIAGMLFIASLESGAGAAEFGGLAVFFILLFSLPLTLVVNAIMLLRNPKSIASCFGFAMIPIALVLIAGIVYQSGLWDKLT